MRCSKCSLYYAFYYGNCVRPRRNLSVGLFGETDLVRFPTKPFALQVASGSGDVRWLFLPGFALSQDGRYCENQFKYIVYAVYGSAKNTTEVASGW